jgi:hypothetical protein
MADAGLLPQRLPLVIVPGNRDTTAGKDAKLVNGYVEKVDESSFQLYKRPGYVSTGVSHGAGAAAGLYNWKGDLYGVWGTALYKNGSVIGTVDSSNGRYQFNQTAGLSISVDRLYLSNGVHGYTWDGTTFAQIIDANYPATTVKGSAYLDGTLYVMDTTGAIWGSSLNNPTTWSALNKIVAQIEPDLGVTISKQLIYVVAFKQWSVEFFYDAAASSGSPLLPVPASRLNYGCASAGTLAEFDGTLIWVATNRVGGRQVISVTDMRAKPVSSKPVERLLNSADLTGALASVYKGMGHEFYILTMPAANLTLVYDMVEGAWAQWTTAAGGYVPLVDTATLGATTVGQTSTSSLTYTMSTDYTTDDGIVFPVDLVTPNFDGGTRQLKFLTSMEFSADQTPGSLLQVRVSDDDYQTWTNFRPVNLGLKRPMLWDCGSFRRRAFHFRHQCPVPLRIQSVDLQIVPGSL